MQVPNVYCGLPGWSGLMFQSWRESIDNRPTAEQVADCLLDPLVLTTLGNFPVPTTKSIRTATYVPGTKHVWLFCDDRHGIDVLIVNPVTMKLVNQFAINNLQVRFYTVLGNGRATLAINSNFNVEQ